MGKPGKDNQVTKRLCKAISIIIHDFTPYVCVKHRYGINI